MSAAEAHLFPYQHFITASLTIHDGSEILQLEYSNHNVRITGWNLRELFSALQQFGVKVLRIIPARYQDVTVAPCSFISTIEITSVN
jgi:hypothetical protein